MKVKNGNSKKLLMRCNRQARTFQLMKWQLINLLFILEKKADLGAVTRSWLTWRKLLMVQLCPATVTTLKSIFSSAILSNIYFKFQKDWNLLSSRYYSNGWAKSIFIMTLSKSQFLIIPRLFYLQEVQEFIYFIINIFSIGILLNSYGYLSF